MWLGQVAEADSLTVVGLQAAVDQELKQYEEAKVLALKFYRK